MTPDVLFWFYKEFDLCVERLRLLRQLNPDVRVFALFGGELSEAGKAESAVRTWTDDFYVYPEQRDSQWKWKNGDRLIADWYRERGSVLEWQTLFVHQWDMLLLAPLDRLFHGLQPEQILLSGFRPMEQIEPWWPWARDPDNRDELLGFKTWLRDRFGYQGPLYACLFIVACLPRPFLERYTNTGAPSPGFLEYKLPTLAKVFDTPVCEAHPFAPWWAADPATKNAPPSQRILNAVGKPVPSSVVFRQALTREGSRLFHPYVEKTPGWLPFYDLVSRLCRPNRHRRKS